MSLNATQRHTLSILVNQSRFADFRANLDWSQIAANLNYREITATPKDPAGRGTIVVTPTIEQFYAIVPREEKLAARNAPWNSTDTEEGLFNKAIGLDDLPTVPAWAEEVQGYMYAIDAFLIAQGLIDPDLQQVVKVVFDKKEDLILPLLTSIWRLGIISGTTAQAIQDIVVIPDPDWIPDVYTYAASEATGVGLPFVTAEDAEESVNFG